MIVGVLGCDQVLGFELMVPGQVFGMANASLAETGHEARYDVRVCAANRATTTTLEWGAVEIRTPFGLDEVVAADVVIVPGKQDFLVPPQPDVIAVLRAAYAAGARIGSICVGAFILAATGLLDGRTVTTHWQWADSLRRRYPAVKVDPAAIFIDDGQMLTSAGVAAGLDLCLHLIRQEAGPDLADRTARRLVLPSWREGGQAPYIESTRPEDDSLQGIVEWMEENADQPLDLGSIARHASISVRSLNRHFRARLGTTPTQLLLQMRIERARRLLESTHLAMDRIAEQSGFATQASLRYHFVRSVGVPPQTYRNNYRQHL
ncbi:GlxA family transcriptional regulator [Mycolicibacterium aichiense]|uniref:AraC family transcriptional regulator n=1 Tax=Mycolicibacterium aichiense TaxID=1799 RepID=A0AAD1HN80_9MYCO|nr:helix-turn-helix domain-containing protein [Mycolicibacterium aichiense]MCV7018852.1 helix-turn-helix domain-containing protein [Mycolicibacterium aichiense]BBX08607.1 AraC family transcriptional regulator [Mycolicibacterium aichiense]STZ82403.1 transcriptional regulator containing an amidase domain and an AraC-type DNA-binding HTH domain [Mycolicibacterium aichiense]